jgi:hypothetical protein
MRRLFRAAPRWLASCEPARRDRAPVLDPVTRVREMTAGFRRTSATPRSRPTAPRFAAPLSSFRRAAWPRSACSRFGRGMPAHSRVKPGRRRSTQNLGTSVEFQGPAQASCAACGTDSGQLPRPALTPRTHSPRAQKTFFLRLRSAAAAARIPAVRSAVFRRRSRPARRRAFPESKRPSATIFPTSDPRRARAKSAWGRAEEARARARASLRWVGRPKGAAGGTTRKPTSGSVQVDASLPAADLGAKHPQPCSLLVSASNQVHCFVLEAI